MCNVQTPIQMVGHRYDGRITAKLRSFVKVRALGPQANRTVAGLRQGLICVQSRIRTTTPEVYYLERSQFIVSLAAAQPYKWRLWRKLLPYRCLLLLCQRLGEGNAVQDVQVAPVCLQL